MNVKVSLGKRSYDIIIQREGIGNLGQYLHQLQFSGKVGIVTNSTIYRLYGEKVIRSLKQCSFSCQTILIPDGEKAKTLQWVGKILNELVQHQFERNSVLVALGGGVIGDITGFAAAVYLRGIPFVQVATTLMAQVDSSVGGKTGVNHPLGKNLIGAFYQPSLVLLDTDTLRTLPKREWIAGLAEVIKYGMIADRTFFRFLEDQIGAILKMKSEIVQSVVKRCCEIKASVVARDELESGLRRILNYGHTIGHALESWGRYRKFIHGEAVGMGMVCEAELSRFLGLCSEEVVTRQRELIQSAGLPQSIPPLHFRDLWSAMLHDKKVASGQVHCVVPRKIGKVEVIPLQRDKVRQWFNGSWNGL